MRRISVFDTTISDYNIGNQIIMDSVNTYLQNIFYKDFFYRLPYMEINSHTINIIKECEFTFFGGTNSLSSKMESYKQWDLNIKKSLKIKDVILFGLGWWQYQNNISLYTKIILRNVLNRKYFHSVRDNYTLNNLKSIGITNVLNTGCPTLWQLVPEHCIQIDKEKAENVILTLTDYNRNLKRDQYLINFCKENFKKVYFWIQGVEDYSYVKENFKNNMEFIDPNLEAYDEVLRKENVEYIGTRLHAGIRALQHKKRAIIIGIDNRALEMQKDFNIPVLHEDQITSLATLVHSVMPIDIKLPIDNIHAWKNQFK
jgi:polysaccharide pyruvyl transferase WcaK-like protein